jgi:threonine synthase
MAGFDEKVGHAFLMDAQARDQWYNSLEKEDIPAVSEANILSTFEQLHLNKGEVFERGSSTSLKGYRGITRPIVPAALVKNHRHGTGQI